MCLESPIEARIGKNELKILKELLISQIDVESGLLQWQLWSDKLTCLRASGEIAIYQVHT
jgi:hypothetical protein